MKGLVLLFLSIAGFGICWGYASKKSRTEFKSFVAKNLLAILLAVVAVGAAVFFSMNTTLRFV